MNIKNLKSKLALFCSATALLTSCGDKKPQQTGYLHGIEFNKDSTQLVITSSYEDTPFQIDTGHYEILKHPENFHTAFRNGSLPGVYKISEQSIMNKLPHALKVETPEKKVILKANRVDQKNQISLLTGFLDNTIALKKPRNGTVNSYYLRPIKPN